MDLYRGTINSETPTGVLQHFGSMTAAIQRLDSMYCTQKMHQVDTHTCKFTSYDREAQSSKVETSAEALNDFGSFLSGVKLLKYSVDITKPLRIFDCWSDDPIGSGAMDLFKEDDQLSGAQRKQLSDIFHPFKGTVYPQYVHMMFSRTQFKDIKKRREKDEIFQCEIEKRRQRSLAIGENWMLAQPHEMVWVDLTLKLRTWALQNKYDAFVYRNECEGQLEDSYVTLKANSKIEKKEDFKFNKERFLGKVGPVFDEFIQSPINKSRSRVVGLFWAGQEPEQFWDKLDP